MSDIGNEISKKQTDEVLTTTAASKTESSTDPSSTQPPKRRGVWKRVRVRPVDAFETAESQNYGHRVFNGLPEELDKVAPPHKGLSVYSGSDDVDESEPPTRDELTTTPSSDDLMPTSSEANTSTKNQTESATTTTTEEPQATTLLADRLEERSEAAEQQSPVSTTTVTSTRRYDLSDEDLMMDENDDDDHTEFPFSFDGVNDEIDESKTDSPITERAYYDDYDVAEFKTESSVGAPVEPAAPDASHASSMMNEVKQKLTELFSFNDDYDYENNVRAKPQHQSAVYTTIDRTKSAENVDKQLENEEEPSAASTESVDAATTEQPQIDTTTTTTVAPSKSFHKKLMESVIYATSTSTEVTHETEICYRGRCIKSDKKP